MHAVMVHGERTLTELDFARLSRLVDPQIASPLADVLANADVTSSRTVRADVVTMNSRLQLVDVDSLSRQVLTLCYPQDAAPAAGFVSVLSPVGASLLGLTTGDTARWHTPHGDECRATIERIEHQPEAMGDYLA
ncbi:MAG: transcription elongation factor GreAB [Comamonadaceae bacterium]|nr:MAG: transcription elongation factor GreAB [Comamonadaceae bacterium]